MLGRAEFAYLIATMAKDAGMLDGKQFAILIWALLLATIMAPIGFSFALNKHVKRLADREQASMRKSDRTTAGRTSISMPVDKDHELRENLFTKEES